MQPGQLVVIDVSGWEPCSACLHDRCKAARRWADRQVRINLREEEEAWDEFVSTVSASIFQDDPTAA